MLCRDRHAVDTITSGGMLIIEEIANYTQHGELHMIFSELINCQMIGISSSRLASRRVLLKTNFWFTVGTKGVIFPL